MARSFASASAQALRHSAAVGGITAPPLSVTAWVNLTDDSTGAAHYIFFLGQAAEIGADRDQFSLFTDADHDVSARTGEAGSSSVAIASSKLVPGTLHHVAGVWASATDRRAFIDGGNKGTNTTSRVPATVDRTTIGDNDNASGTHRYWNGPIAEVKVWNIALSDADVAEDFRLGFPRPDALVAHWRLIGKNAPEPDWVGGFDMTLLNAPTAAAHPRIIMPRRTYPGFVLEAAAGTDATASPLGVAATGQTGLVSTFLSQMAAIAGVSATGAIGIPGLTWLHQISGVAGTGAVGLPATILHAVALLRGLEAQGFVGTVDANNDIDATASIIGLEITGSIGAVEIQMTIVVTPQGVEAVGQTGVMSIGGFLGWIAETAASGVWSDRSAAPTLWVQ